MTTQRDLLAALVREFDNQDDYDWSKAAHESPTQEQRMADFLIARGVRVVDAETLAAALDVIRPADGGDWEWRELRYPPIGGLMGGSSDGLAIAVLDALDSER